MYTYTQNDIQSNDNDFQEDQRAYNTVRAMFGFFAKFIKMVPYQVLQLICLFLFDLILYVPSTIFQLNRDVSSWVEPVLS